MLDIKELEQFDANNAYSKEANKRLMQRVSDDTLREDQRSASDRNTSALINIRDTFNANAELVTLFEKSDVRSDNFFSAIYASVKALNLAKRAQNKYHKLDENTRAIATSVLRIQSEMKASDEKTLTKAQIDAAISRDIDYEDILSERRNAVLDKSTIAAQSQQVLQVLTRMNIIAKVSRDTFKVCKANALAKALQKNML